MTITTKNEIDRIENVDRFWVQVRYAKVVEEDGVEIARSFTRKVFSSDDDYSAETAEVKGVCDAVFTVKCKTDYAAWKKVREDDMEESDDEESDDEESDD